LEAAESRRFQRVPVSLFGRYMLQSKEEYPCQTIEMSPGDMLVFGPAKPALGENVVVYLDELGRFTGPCVRVTDSGFALLVNLPMQKRDKLADQLTWYANRNVAGMREDRRHERITPLMRRTMLRLPDGREAIVRILDISSSGVGIECDFLLPLGTPIVIGATPAVVVRQFDGGFAGEFSRPLSAGSVDESTRL
jgi:hypothetical protein